MRPVSAPATAAATNRAAHPRLELAAIYAEHFQFVWRSLRRMGGNPEELDDMTQDVFLVVARRLEEFRGQSSIRTWLFAIAANVLRSHRRAHSRHRRRVAAYGSTLQGLARTDTMECRDAGAILAQLLAQLDEDKRAVYVLIELEGLTAVEVAGGLGVNVNTIYTRIRAARKVIRRAARSMQRAEAGAR
jgi:RNA polymerase sigma-70 factor (ECF subfamily)